MAWTWTTYKSWTLPDGKVWTVIAAAGMIGATALLWVDRSNVLYPAAVDQAEIMGAILERQRARLVDRPFVSYHNTYAGETWGLEVQSNAVALYPSRGFYVSDYEDGVADLEDGYLDLSGETEEGAQRLIGRAWPEYEFYPFDEEMWMGLLWWRSSIWADAARFGDLEYMHTNNLYLTSDILNQAAKPLSAMRWTDGPVTIDTGAAYVQATWSVTSGLYSVSTPWATIIADALGQLPGALPIGDADLIATGAVRVATHVVWSDVEPEYIGTNQYFSVIVTEQVGGYVWDQYFLPEIVNGVRSVWSLGVCTDPGSVRYTGQDGGWVYLHGLGTESNVWSGVEAEAGADGRYRPETFKWDGRFVSIPMTITSDEDKTHVVNDGYGWSAGPHAFVVDWRFQCLTNAAQFWGTP